jgi:tetratricopeptide (TPR) repeat protein
MIQRHYEEALPWLDQALSIFEAAGARLDTAMVWSELGVCRLGVGQDELAMELFRKAEAVNKEAGFIHNYQVVLANIGNVYLHRRDYLTALAYYQRAVSLARQINDPVSVKKMDLQHQPRLCKDSCSGRSRLAPLRRLSSAASAAAAPPVYIAGYDSSCTIGYAA